MSTFKYFLTCLLLGSFVVASEQEGIIESKPYKKLTDNNSDFGVMNLSTESDDIKVDDAVHNLLSHKFTLSGEELNKKITESYDKVSKFENSDIINFLNQEKARNVEDSSSTVTIYLPVTKTEEDIKNALLAAAYFPKELDPEKTASYELYDQKHVHEQLIKTLNYAHPLTKSNLEGFVRVYYLPENHSFSKVVEKLDDLTDKDFDVFCIDVKRELMLVEDFLNFDLRDQKQIRKYFRELAKTIEKN